MQREFFSAYSPALNRDMSIVSYGHAGVPIIVFPCQDGMSDNWESFGMHETLSDMIDQGRIRLFCVDSVDRESWSARGSDNARRAWMQECYCEYVFNELVPMVNEISGSGIAPLVTGFSLGATHALIVFLRRPDLFSGCLCCSGVYDVDYFWDGWMDGTLYENSPVHFMANMPRDHRYIPLYNERRIVLCVGQGRWEDEGRRTSAIMRDIFQSKGINAWVDFWGYDVDHDWPWWKKQVRYFLPRILES